MELAKAKNLEALVLHSGDARSWSLFPAALMRVANFCKRYDSDADPLMLVAELKMAFVHPAPTAYILLLVEDGVPMGHLLVSLEQWFGTTAATVIQYESDRPVPREFSKKALEFVEQWARNLGAKYVRCLARDEKVARAFETFHGFEKTRIVMQKSLDVSLSTGVDQDAPTQ